MVRLVTLLLAILVVSLEVNAQRNEEFYKIFRAQIDNCHQPLKYGNCASISNAFYYNAAKGKCERFPFGRCGGNSNKFQTRSLCIQICVKYENLFSGPQRIN